MNSPSQPVASVVLAGERVGGNALAKHLHLPAAVLAEVGGVPSIGRVMSALDASAITGNGLIVGPAQDVLDAAPRIRALATQYNFDWLPPASGPSASAALGARHLSSLPLLVTTADHALLTTAIIDAFSRDALTCDADFVVGLVDYDRVMAAFPDTRRTRLRFADASFCGANLFLLKTSAALRVLEFWQQLEHDRKKPWRMATKLGVRTLFSYLLGLLNTRDAFSAISARAGARVGFVKISTARAAIDVDSVADWKLANQIVETDG